MPSIPVIPDIKKKDIISLSFSDNSTFDNISELKTRKIIAIGETVHGSETMNEVAAQMIKYQVEHNNCRLIVLEVPTEFTLGWNRFIQGDSLFKIDNITDDFKLLNLSPSIMIDLVKWLKQFNEKKKEKVWLIGMDINPSYTNTAQYLFNFIYRINENRHQKLLDSLCFNLYSYSSFPQALSFLQKNKEIENLLSTNEYRILNNCIKNSISCGINKNNRLMIRDSLMFLNSTFLINLLCPLDEKVTMYSHLLHVNYKTISPEIPFHKSLGAYMKKLYESNFYTIAVLASEGFIRTQVGDSIGIKTILTIPPENSLENLMLRTNNTFCFIPISALPVQLSNIREIGLQYSEKQFYTISLISRLEALIFVRNSKVFELLKGTPTNPKELFNFDIQKENEKFKRLTQLKANMK
jgi:erythromycin esterase-like protein